MPFFPQSYILLSVCQLTLKLATFRLLTLIKMSDDILACYFTAGKKVFFFNHVARPSLGYTHFPQTVLKTRVLQFSDGLQRPHHHLQLDSVSLCSPPHLLSFLCNNASVATCLSCFHKDTALLSLQSLSIHSWLEKCQVSTLPPWALLSDRKISSPSFCILPTPFLLAIHSCWGISELGRFLH